MCQIKAITLRFSVHVELFYRIILYYMQSALYYYAVQPSYCLHQLSARASSTVKNDRWPGMIVNFCRPKFEFTNTTQRNNRKLHKTLLFCVDGFATDYDLIYPCAHSRESSFTPVTELIYSSLDCFCDVQIGPFDTQFGRQHWSEWVSLDLGHFGTTSFRSRWPTTDVTVPRCMAPSSYTHSWLKNWSLTKPCSPCYSLHSYITILNCRSICTCCRTKTEKNSFMTS